MKAIFKTTIIIFIIWGTNSAYGITSKKDFQNINIKTTYLSSIYAPTSNFHKTMKFDFLDNSNSCLRLLDGTLFFTGLVLYCTYSNVNSSYYHDYSYRNSSLAFMGIGICGGFTTYVLESNHHSYYGPRSSIKNNKNVQLSLNGNGLRLKVSL